MSLSFSKKKKSRKQDAAARNKRNSMPLQEQEEAVQPGMTPVGVTIAMKQHNKQQQQQQRNEENKMFAKSVQDSIRESANRPQDHHRQQQQQPLQGQPRLLKRRSSRTKLSSLSPPSSGKSVPGKVRRGRRHPVASFRVFVETAVLYGACLVMPTMLGFLLRLYDDPRGMVDSTWDSVRTLVVSPRRKKPRPVMRTTVVPEESVDSSSSSSSSSTTAATATAEAYEWLLTTVTYPAYEYAASHLCYRSGGDDEEEDDDGNTDASFGQYFTNGAGAVLETMVKTGLVSSTAVDNAWAWFCPPHPFQESALASSTSRSGSGTSSSNNRTVFSKDAAWGDVGIVAVMALTLAAVRCFVVQWTVPQVLDQPERLRALIRCKSVGLLSSEYQKCQTPVRQRSVLRRGVVRQHQHRHEDQQQEEEGDGGVESSSSHAGALLLPAMPSMITTRSDTTTQESQHHPAFQLQPAPVRLSPPLPFAPATSAAEGMIPSTITTTTTTDTARLEARQQEEEDEGDYDACNVGLRLEDATEDRVDDDLAEGGQISEQQANTAQRGLLAPPPPPPRYASALPDAALLHNLTASLQRMAEEQRQEQEQDRLESSSSSSRRGDSSRLTKLDRLYAAPRYATALFRWLYCTAAAFLALKLFGKSRFWPWYVFGSGGRTAACWDLSGGLSMALDSDFDHANAVLRAYFLWQASYHVHSGAFHVLSLLILLLQKPTTAATTTTTMTSTAETSASSLGAAAAGRFWRVQQSTAQYVRSLSQHVLALLLIATAYVFSSLRRLAAIGMFAFDVSSWFLHLLQISINAKPGSPLRRPAVVRTLYYGAVIPSFVWMRFVVWPALWYSVATESSQWLHQLERTVVPGSALILKSLVHVWMLLLMGCTVVYFHRLLHHEHLQRILLANTSTGGSSLGAISTNH